MGREKDSLFGIYFMSRVYRGMPSRAFHVLQMEKNTTATQANINLPKRRYTSVQPSGYGAFSLFLQRSGSRRFILWLTDKFNRCDIFQKKGIIKMRGV